jgi:hypothetical protein
MSQDNKMDTSASSRKRTCDGYMPFEKRVKIPTAIYDRLHLINGNLGVSDARGTAMSNVRETISEAAWKLYNIVSEQAHDTGRLIAAIDGLQSVKDVACTSLLLAHGLRKSTLGAFINEVENSGPDDIEKLTVKGKRILKALNYGNIDDFKWSEIVDLVHVEIDNTN